MKPQCLVLFLFLLLFSSVSASPTLSASLKPSTEQPVTSTEPESNGTTTTDLQKSKAQSEGKSTDREIQLEVEMKNTRQKCSLAIERMGLLAEAYTTLQDDLSRYRSRQAELERSLRSAESRAAAARTEAARRLAGLEADLAALRTAGSAAAAERRRTAERQTDATRQLRTQLAGLSALTSAFAQQTNASARAVAQKLTGSLTRLEASFRDAKNAMERRLKGLEGRQEACELRLSMWNVSRVLQRCQKAARDERQEAELQVLRMRTNHLATAAAGLRNLTNTLQSILYDNNRITNSLTNFKNRARSAIDSLVLNMAHLAKTLPKSCSSEVVDPSRSSNILLIVPNFRAGEMRAAQCVFTELDSWTVIQQRQKHDVDFNRRWAEYETGFGEAEGDYWLGLRLIHNIVSSGKWKLRVDLWDEEGRYFYAIYRHFYVGTRGTNYRLKVGGYYGNASDTLSRASGYGFSAPDRDADGTVVHCAQFEEAGWWMAHCHDSNLNGKKPFGIIWYHTPLQDYLHLRRTRMMVAPLTAADMTTEAPVTTEMPTSPEVDRNETIGLEGNDTSEEWEGFGNSTEVEGNANSTEDYEWSQNSTDIRDDYEWLKNSTDKSEITTVLVEFDSSKKTTERPAIQNTTPSQNTAASTDGSKSKRNVTQSTTKSKPMKTERSTAKPMLELPTKKPEKAEQSAQKPLKVEQTSEKKIKIDQSNKKPRKVDITESSEESSDEKLKKKKEEKQGQGSEEVNKQGGTNPKKTEEMTGEELRAAKMKSSDSLEDEFNEDDIKNEEDEVEKP